MPVGDVRYPALKKAVEKRGGLRLAMHGGIRDQLVEMAVEEFPCDCSADRIEEVLRARMRIRAREKYGSVLAAFLVSVLINAIVKLIVDWWREKHSHRILMEGWCAQANPNVQAPVDRPKAS